MAPAAAAASAQFTQRWPELKGEACDRCQQDPSLLATWAPIVAAENSIHRGWFLQQIRKQAEEKAKSKRKGSPHIRSDKFCKEFQIFIVDLHFQPAAAADVGKVEREFDEIFDSQIQVLKVRNCFNDDVESKLKERASLCKAAICYPKWCYCSADPRWEFSLAADHQPSGAREFEKIPCCTFEGDPEPTFAWP